MEKESTIRLNVDEERILRFLVGLPCPTKGCEGNLTVRYNMPITKENMIVSCIYCDFKHKASDLEVLLKTND